MGSAAENDAFARLAGIELIEARLGYAKARMAIGPQHLNGLGGVHGGAIFTLADYAFAAACNCDAPPTVAINANISFLKGVTQGTLYAEAQEATMKERLGSYIVQVTNEAGEVVATFQGLTYRKRTPPGA